MEDSFFLSCCFSQLQQYCQVEHSSTTKRSFLLTVRLTCTWPLFHISKPVNMLFDCSCPISEEENPHCEAQQSPEAFWSILSLENYRLFVDDFILGKVRIHFQSKCARKAKWFNLLSDFLHYWWLFVTARSLCHR